MIKKINLKIGDNVEIISGFYKNRTGEITKIFRNSGKIIVKDINYKVKHIKPKNDNNGGKIVKIEAPIDHSNVKLKV